MTSPSDPGVNGIPKVQHDDMPQEGHDEQLAHAGGGSEESGESKSEESEEKVEKSEDDEDEE